MRRADIRDLLGGLLIVAIGGAFLIVGSSLRFGTAERIGPGFFPLVTAVIIIGLGGLMIALSFLRSGAAPRISWRPLCVVCASIGVFIVTTIYLGYVPAVFMTVVTASLAERGHTVQALAVACLMTLGIWLIFDFGLGLQLPAFRSPF